MGLLGSIFRIFQRLLWDPNTREAEQRQGEQEHTKNARYPQPPKSEEPHFPPHDHNRKPRRAYRNENLINQNNPYYQQLRARANKEGDAMAKCFDDSHRAYKAGDGARAKVLSEEGHAHKREMNNLNAQASDWIFYANNTDNQAGEVDLHGLYVKEAIARTERAIQDAQSRGDSELRLIVGKGLHSLDHVAKLKPAIEELVQKYKFSVHLDEHNAGVLVVALDGRRSGYALAVDDVIRRLKDKDEECVVM